MAKTDFGLIAWATSKIGSAYMFGFTGIVTESAIQAKKRQYPEMYDAEYVRKCRANIGRWATDCSGLIDSYIGVDKSADGYYAMADTRGVLSSFPMIPGYLVHKDGHIGVYIGKGEVVEARGIDYGVVRTKLAGRGWLRWSKCPLLDYTGLPDDEEDTDMLKSGDKGEPVGAWQKALNHCGAKLDVDSKFGPATVTKTKAFQTAHKLLANGAVDDMTYGHMLDSLADKIDARDAKIKAARAALG